MVAGRPWAANNENGGQRASEYTTITTGAELEISANVPARWKGQHRQLAQEDYQVWRDLGIRPGHPRLGAAYR